MTIPWLSVRAAALASVLGFSALISPLAPERASGSSRERETLSTPELARLTCGRTRDLPAAGTGTQTGESLLQPAEFRYLFTYPANCAPGWTVDLQGVTHDSVAWYFTQKATLWRFPVGRDLGRFELLPKRGALYAGMPAALARDGYNHFGALVYHHGLLLIPITGRPPAIIGIFRARDFSYLGHLQLPAQRGAGWLAVGPGDELYSSDSELNGARGLLVYSIDWATLTSGNLPASPGTTRPGQQALVQAIPRATIPLLDELGQPVRLRSMQGGVFSDRLHIYLVNGYCEGSTRDTGISAFAISGDTGRRVARSSSRPGPYEFEYHPGHRGLFWCREEPEGITIWDLDDGRAPGIRGQLHVLMIDNAIWDYGALYFRHYRLQP